MDNNKWLVERFEENRSRLRALAYRMLGSTGEAEDAVQESWLRLSRLETTTIENLNGWLTTVTSRICLDMLRARRAQQENALGKKIPEQIQDHHSESNPEQELLLADSVGFALLVVLDTLTPAERIAFVLHDLFAVSFDEIARITNRSPVAARQLASRARRRVRGKTIEQTPGTNRQTKIIEAFYAASRRGDFEQLLVLLDPDVVLKVEGKALSSEAASIEIRGAEKVAKQALAARTEFSEVAIVGGKAAIIVAAAGRLARALLFTIARNKIVKIEVITNRESLLQLEIVPLANANI